MRDSPLELRTKQGQKQYRRKHENLEYVLTKTIGLSCRHGCGLICSRQNKAGFVWPHTPDGREKKFHYRDLHGVTGICTYYMNRTFEDFKERVDEEFTYCYPSPACQNCHKEHETDYGL